MKGVAQRDVFSRKVIRFLAASTGPLGSRLLVDQRGEVVKTWMHVWPASAELVIAAPAKLNLFLEVLAKRNDGFHEIETLMCPVNLYDTLYFRDEPRGPVTLRCELSIDQRATTTAGEPLPVDAENLAFRAIQELRQESGCHRGAALRLIKRIPIAAGLAGGSSDAASALIAANVGWGLGYSRSRLAEIAARLGSDVPFFLTGGMAVCRGRGERITPIRQFFPLHFVVVRPPAGLSTATVYQSCRAAPQATDIHPLLEALETGNLSEIGRRLHNRLQPAARELSPWIARLETEFARADVVGHLMSGSGSGYFGLCRSARHARRVAGRLRNREIGRVFAVRTCWSATAG